LARTNGYNLFLKDEYSTAQLPPDLEEASWNEKRTFISKRATAKWNEQSFEMRRLRRSYSQKAKEANQTTKLNRQLCLGSKH